MIPIKSHNEMRTLLDLIEPLFRQKRFDLRLAGTNSRQEYALSRVDESLLGLRDALAQSLAEMMRSSGVNADEECKEFYARAEKPEDVLRPLGS